MKLEIMFTTSDLILFSGAALVTILGLIFILRRYMNHQAEVDLTDKYKDKKMEVSLGGSHEIPGCRCIPVAGVHPSFQLCYDIGGSLVRI
jgi:hypothetical protein